ncbi:hypothetical protein [Pseudogemmobacter faecipullorum]|uniref:Lipoprotein n=1 Tax=Pseudogemmobacter faecipullorum TaxID=2755041 RepID=A0ABS8CKC4_9RHOB|nr:hypothetical protein [Pseudogemmobacter faecipullorum]
MTRSPALAAALMALLAIGACAPEAEMRAEGQKPEYLGIRTALLEGDMVSFRVTLKGDATAKEIEDYARCAAAQYALIRGAGFARHVRTNVAKSGGTTRGDAVWVISAALPLGLKTIDAEVTVRDCGELGIPTV